MKYFRYLILLFCVLISSPILEAEDYFNERTGIHFKIPNRWTLSPVTNVRFVPMSHPKKIATVNVSIHYFKEPVTANGLQRIRIASKYDGWVHLFERPGTEFESAVANMDDSYVAVYTKKVLDENLQITSKLVGEYYFTKDNIGTIISIETYKTSWGKIQNDVKEVLESFWVGEGDRPHVSLPEKAGLGWEMIGKSASNQFFVKKFDLPSTPNTTWSLSQKKNGSFDPENIVITDDTLIVYDNLSITALSLNKGKKRWVFNTSPIKSHMVAKDNQLFFINESKTRTLVGLTIDTGNILFKLPLNETDYSEIIYSQGMLFIHSPTKLTAYDSRNGQTLWEKQGTYDVDFYPVANKDIVVTLASPELLLAFGKESGTHLWERRLNSPVLITPTIDDAHLFISQGKSEAYKYHEMPTGQIQCLSLENKGESLWTHSGSTIAKPIVSSIALGNNQLVSICRIQEGSLFESKWHIPLPNLDLLICLDKNTGEPLWQKQLFTPFLSQLIHPIITATDVVLENLQQSEPYISSIRHHSGSIINELNASLLLPDTMTYKFYRPLSPKSLMLVSESDDSFTIQMVAQQQK